MKELEVSDTNDKDYYRNLSKSGWDSFHQACEDLGTLDAKLSLYKEAGFWKRLKFLFGKEIV